MSGSAVSNILRYAMSAVLTALIVAPAAGGPPLLAGPTGGDQHQQADGPPLPPGEEPLFVDQPPGEFGAQEHGRRGHPPGFKGHPGEDDRARVREFIERHFPEFAKVMRRRRGFEPKVVQRILPRVRQIMKEYEHDEELGELGVEELRLEFNIHRTAVAYHSSSRPEERERLRAELFKLVTARFNAHQKRSRLQIARIEGRLGDLREQLEMREANREEALAREVENLLTTPEERRRAQRDRDRFGRKGRRQRRGQE